MNSWYYEIVFWVPVFNSFKHIPGSGICGVIHVELFEELRLFLKRKWHAYLILQRNKVTECRLKIGRFGWKVTSLLSRSSFSGVGLGRAHLTVMGCTSIQPLGFLGWLAFRWAFTECSPEQGAMCSDPELFPRILQDFSWLMFSHYPHTCPTLHPNCTPLFLNALSVFLHPHLISLIPFLGLFPPPNRSPLSFKSSLKWQLPHEVTSHAFLQWLCFLLPWASTLLQEDCSLGPGLGGDRFWSWFQALSYHWSFWRLFLLLLAQGLTHLVFSRV